MRGRQRAPPAALVRPRRPQHSARCRVRVPLGHEKGQPGQRAVCSCWRAWKSPACLEVACLPERTVACAHRWRIGHRRSANVAEAAAQLAELRRARPGQYPQTAHEWAPLPPREELAPPLLCAVCFRRTRLGSDLKVRLRGLLQQGPAPLRARRGRGKPQGRRCRAHHSSHAAPLAPPCAQTAALARNATGCTRRRARCAARWCTTAARARRCPTAGPWRPPRPRLRTTGSRPGSCTTRATCGPPSAALTHARPPRAPRVDASQAVSRTAAHVPSAGSGGACALWGCLRARRGTFPSRGRAIMCRCPCPCSCGSMPSRERWTQHCQDTRLGCRARLPVRMHARAPAASAPTAPSRARARAQEEAGPPRGASTCLYCRAPCDADLFAREPVWECAGCGEAAAHVQCFHAAHAAPAAADGCARAASASAPARLAPGLRMPACAARAERGRPWTLLWRAAAPRLQRAVQVARGVHASVRFAALRAVPARRREEGDGHDSAGPPGAAAQRTDTDGKDSGRHARSASACPAARSASHGANQCHGQAECLCLCECPRPEAAEAETAQHSRPRLLVPSCMLGSTLRRACAEPCLVRGVPDCKLALWFVQGVRPAGRSRASPRATSARPAWARCWARWASPAWAAGRAMAMAPAPATAAGRDAGGSRRTWMCRRPTCAASGHTGTPPRSPLQPVLGAGAAQCGSGGRLRQRESARVCARAGGCGRKGGVVTAR
jgi:hypothetical protein